MTMLLLPPKLSNRSMFPTKRAPPHSFFPTSVLASRNQQAKRCRTDRRDDAGNDHHILSVSPIRIDPTPIDVKRIKVVQEIHLFDFPADCAERETIYKVLSPLLLEEKNMMLQQPSIIPSHRQAEAFAKAAVSTKVATRQGTSGSSEAQIRPRWLALNPNLDLQGRAIAAGRRHPESGNEHARSSHNNPNKPAAGSSCDDSEEKQHRQGKRFHSYQSNMWEKRFTELVKFQSKHGHCLVPCNYKENQVLARWVKRQRHQYKRKNKNESAGSTLCKDREQRLRSLGFVWDSQKAAWEERFQELVRFHRIHRHCNVNMGNSRNSANLITWVKCQRRHFTLYSSPASSSAIMCQERIDKLNSIGFNWTSSSLK